MNEGFIEETVFDFLSFKCIGLVIGKEYILKEAGKMNNDG